MAAAFGLDDLARRQLIDEVRQACTTQGFFALANHGIPQTLLDDVLVQSQDLFSLPDEIKGSYDKG
jgi:isopenicillin N synthase-like dioxygenase